MSSLRGWGAVAGGVLLYLALEAGLFRTGLYRTFLEPDSYAGTFEFVVEAERTRPVHTTRQVLAIGDSRMALRAWRANQLQSSITFGNAGIGAATPRVWSYILPEVDPQRDRYEAILFLVDDYDDEDIPEDLRRRQLDVQLMAARIDITDIPGLVGSYATWPERIDVLRKVLFKGFTYKRDLQEFLKNPGKRFADIAFKKQQWKDVLAGYRGEERSLAGLAIDWPTMTATYPENVTELNRHLIQDNLLRPGHPQTGRMGGYRREYWARIGELYRGSRTRLLFCRVPRAPIVRPASLVRKVSSSVRELASQPNVTLLDEHLLDYLERPEYFMDPIHLNAEGCLRLTETLTREVVKVLGPQRAL